MATRRFKSPTMKFGVPLSVPGSLYVERCYAKHGKGELHAPPRDAAIEWVLIDESRQLWNVRGHCGDGRGYLTDAAQVDRGWRILGWRMADGSMPLGEYDEVDPELAQMDYLPVPSSPESHSSQPVRIEPVVDGYAEAERLHSSPEIASVPERTGAFARWR